MTLEQISAKHPTDKASVHSYLPFYERLFAALNNTKLAVCELGVDGGGSLCIWEEYFPNAKILGVDINVKPPYIGDHQRIYHLQIDAYEERAPKLIKELVGEFSVIIDDGPHSIESQRIFCANYPPLLGPGGIAIVEDIQDINQAPSLHAALPEGFIGGIVDLRHIKGRYDDVLFIAWRK